MNFKLGFFLELTLELKYAEPGKTMHGAGGFWLGMKLNLRSMHLMSKWIQFVNTILLLYEHIRKLILSEVTHILWLIAKLTGSLDPSSAIPVETKHCGNINGQMGEDQVSRFPF